MIKKLSCSAAILALALAFGATPAVASPISVVNSDETITYGTLTCVVAGTTDAGCVGYFGGGFFDDGLALRIGGVGGSEAEQADFINSLAGTAFTAEDADKTEVPGGPGNFAFQVFGEYFLIKIGEGTVAFWNTAGVLLDITWAAVPGTGSGLSLFTQFGGEEPPPFDQPVPEPGALALLGIGLLALGIARRRRASAP